MTSQPEPNEFTTLTHSYNYYDPEQDATFLAMVFRTETLEDRDYAISGYTNHVKLCDGRLEQEQEPF